MFPPVLETASALVAPTLSTSNAQVGLPPAEFEDRVSSAVKVRVIVSPSLALVVSLLSDTMETEVNCGAMSSTVTEEPSVAEVTATPALEAAASEKAMENSTNSLASASSKSIEQSHVAASESPASV